MFNFFECVLSLILIGEKFKFWLFNLFFGKLDKLLLLLVLATFLFLIVCKCDCTSCCEFMFSLLIKSWLFLIIVELSTALVLLNLLKLFLFDGLLADCKSALFSFKIIPFCFETDFNDCLVDWFEFIFLLWVNVSSEIFVTGATKFGRPTIWCDKRLGILRINFKI
jgi:hypothetical protein